MHALFLGSAGPASLSLHVFPLSLCQLVVTALSPMQALPLHPCSISAAVARWSCWTVTRNSLQAQPAPWSSSRAALPRQQSLFTAAIDSLASL